MKKNLYGLGVLVVCLSFSGAALALTAQEELGKSIFFDANLSINQNQSCATCHASGVGWTGPDAAINAFGAVYEGSIPGRFGNRKPPTSAYATQSPIFYLDKTGLFVGGNFWDGRATGEKLGNPAADQAQGPFLNPMEQALPDSACVVYRVCSASYPVSFEQVWGYEACDIAWPNNVENWCKKERKTLALSDKDRTMSNMAYDKIGLSIAAYEASPEVNAFTSKYDLSYQGMAKLTQQEQQGFALFRGKGMCHRCHISNGQEALFTDYTYDNLGVPRNPDNPFYNFNPAGYNWIDLGLGGFLANRMDYQQYASDNNGKHKVPTLRNVDKWVPYLVGEQVKAYSHNGYFKTLKQIVHFYNTRDTKPTCDDPFTRVEDAMSEGCWPAPEVPDNVNTAELGNLGLTPDEEDAIVAFLKTLSDGYTQQ